MTIDRAYLRAKRRVSQETVSPDVWLCWLNDAHFYSRWMAIFDGV